MIIRLFDRQDLFYTQIVRFADYLFRLSSAATQRRLIEIIIINFPPYPAKLPRRELNQESGYCYILT